MLYVIPATIRHARRMGRFLREADKAEARALRPDLDPTELLISSIMLSDQCYTVMLDSVPVGMLGSTDLCGDLAPSLWLTGTDLLTARQFEFLRGAPEFLERITRKHDLYQNYAHAENEVHLQWLRWMGCELVREVQLNGHPFVEFTYVPPRNRPRRTRHLCGLNSSGREGPG